MDRTVPKRTAPCCNHFCQLYWSSRPKSLLLAGLSTATMFSNWSGLTERVGLLPVSLVWYDDIFFVYFLDHSGEKSSCWVTTGLRIGAVYVYIGACLGILAAVALLSTLTHTGEKITTERWNRETDSSSVSWYFAISQYYRPAERLGTNEEVSTHIRNWTEN